MVILVDGSYGVSGAIFDTPGGGCMRRVTGAGPHMAGCCPGRCKAMAVAQGSRARTRRTSQYICTLSQQELAFSRRRGFVFGNRVGRLCSRTDGRHGRRGTGEGADQRTHDGTAFPGIIGMDGSEVVLVVLCILPSYLQALPSNGGDGLARTGNQACEGTNNDGRISRQLDRTWRTMDCMSSVRFGRQWTGPI